MFLSFPVHWFWDIAFWFKWDPALCINSLQLRVLWWSMEKYRAECRRVVPAVFSRLGGHLSPPRSGDLVASWDCSVWLEIYFIMKSSSVDCGLGKLSHGWSQLQLDSEPSSPYLYGQRAWSKLALGGNFGKSGQGAPSQLQLQDPEGKGSKGGQQQWPCLYPRFMGTPCVGAAQGHK